MTNLAMEYAAALFMLACEDGKQRAYGKALNEIGQAFSADPEYLTLLASPAISMEERLSAIRAAFGARVPEHVLSFLLLMCEKGRIAHFPEAVKEYEKLLLASERILDATVTSAVALTDEEKQRLQAALEKQSGGKVNIAYALDRELLGGLIVEIDGKILDGSVRDRLQRVKEVISDEHKT